MDREKLNYIDGPDGKSWRDRRLCITDQEAGSSQLDREGGARKEEEEGSHGADESNAPTRGQFRNITRLTIECPYMYYWKPIVFGESDWLESNIMGYITTCMYLLQAINRYVAI